MLQAQIVVRVHPRSHRQGVEVTETGVVTVRVRAAPERGKANAAIIEALARALQVPPSAVEIVRGHVSRDKVVVVDGITQEEAMRRLGSRGDS
ncbi:MAG: DUF167 domain-containing protein [Chloroflexi bacterium]|nr:DUF167 domain-containing protein [Chloroflexota bacterium]